MTDPSSVPETPAAPKPDHTPEPWSWQPADMDGDEAISGAHITPFSSSKAVDCGDYQGLCSADAERIVAAVNACAGIPTKHLATLKVGDLIEVAWDALRQAQSILWMAERYADAGGSGGPEMRDYGPAAATVQQAAAYFERVRNPAAASR